MSALPRSADFTDKDFDSLRLRIQALIKSVFPTWTDFSVTNFGEILLEAFAFVGDVLTFTQDNQALESRITTVTQRRNLLALVKLLAYKPPGATAATAEVTFTGIGLVANTPIPAGTIVRTQSENPVEFQLLSNVLLTVAQPTAIAIVEHSKTQTENTAATGQPNQTIAAGQTPYLDGSSSITDGSGSWTQVDNFLDSGSADRHFVIDVDNNDRATVTFGDGINGKIPTGTIAWTYKTGGGALGNVEAGSINKIDTTLVDVLSNVANVTAMNVAAASGGADREAPEVTKIKAPASIRAVRTTVSREDFVARAVEVPDVARALFLTSDDDPVIPLNSGQLYAVPTDLGFPSAITRQKIKDRCTKTFPCMATFELRYGADNRGVAPTQYLDIGVAARVSFARGIDTDAKRSSVKQAIINSLREYFAPLLADGTPNPAVDFGTNIKKADGTPAGVLALSDLIDRVRDVDGVRKIDPLPTGFTVSAVRRISTNPLDDVTVLAPGAHIDIPIALRDWPRLDGEVLGTPNVVVVDADSGTMVP